MTTSTDIQSGRTARIRLIGELFALPLDTVVDRVAARERVAALTSGWPVSRLRSLAQACETSPVGGMAALQRRCATALIAATAAEQKD